MSFDLYIFDRDDLPDDDEAIGALMEDDSRWGAPLTPRLAEFVAHLERQYPGLDDDADGSPWASWPLTDSMVDGTGIGLNVVWSRSADVGPAIRRIAAERMLTVYDPQAGAVFRPAASSAPSSEHPSPRRSCRYTHQSDRSENPAEGPRTRSETRIRQ